METFKVHYCKDDYLRSLTSCGRFKFITHLYACKWKDVTCKLCLKQQYKILNPRGKEFNLKEKGFKVRIFRNGINNKIINAASVSKHEGITRI